MYFTVRDAMSMEKFKNLRLVAGINGLSKQITKIGILDYEFTTATASTYISGEFVVTSFLYAKDDESKILEAVQRLDECGVSGIAIKNVFFDVLPPLVLEYAHKNKLPMFILDVPIYFEDLIVEFSNSIRTYSDYSRHEESIDKILKELCSGKDLERLIKDIHANIKTNYFFAFISPIAPMVSPEIVDMLIRFKNTLPPFCCAIKYKTGLLIVFSFETSLSVFPKKIGFI